MGRPKEFDSDIVLQAATDCFWADGIAKTSISSLVAAMNIQRSSFYNSFTSREGILTLVLERYLQASPLASLVGLQEEKGGEADLQLVDLILDFSHFLAEQGKGRGCLFFNGLSELQPEDGQAYEIYFDYYARLTDGLSQILGRVAQASHTGEATGPLTLQHILCILIGLAHYSKLDPSEHRLAKIGLEQLAGLSPHFASLIRSQPRTIETFRMSNEEDQRLRA